MGIIFLLFLSLPAFSSGEGVTEIAPPGNDQLPVSSVTLYTAGLAQMVHETVVRDNEVIYFQVEPNDINDILKSLTIEDLGGGTVDVVNFDSSDPLNVVLGDLRINPSGSPSLTNFLRQAQGERVTATTAAGSFEGRIFSIEEKILQTPGGSESRIVLNLSGIDGIRPVDITSLHNIKFSDSGMQNELLTALGKIADSRTKTVRTLKISFKGEGERHVRLSYIRAVPLWKTSYRLTIDKNGTPRLEGWAIVQNTGSSAWNDISLSFAAGQPNAFTMDLSTPKYVTRQRAEIASGSPIGPTEYERAYKSEPAPSMSRAYEAPAMAASEGLYDYAYEKDEAYTPAPTVSQASGNREGNFYRYEVNHPVTVEPRSSAMIPIIQQENAGSSLGVYDPAYDLVFKGLRLENDTEAHWASGPATVIEGRYYGGDAILPDMIPGSSRLLTYAVHGTLEVDKDSTSSSRKISALKISGGVLYRTEKMLRETVYRIAGDEKSLLLIHPKQAGWKLVESPEIFEENAGEYRFSLTDWNEPVKVIEEYIISNQFSLMSFQYSDLDYYMSWEDITPGMKRAFEKITELKRKADAVRIELNSLNSELNRINRDQGRIRENMKVLDKESELFAGYSEQLAAQEEEISRLNEEIRKAERRMQAANTEISDYISGLEL